MLSAMRITMPRPENGRIRDVIQPLTHAAECGQKARLSYDWVLEYETSLEANDDDRFGWISRATDLRGDAFLDANDPPRLRVTVAKRACCIGRHDFDAALAFASRLIVSMGAEAKVSEEVALVRRAEGDENGESELIARGTSTQLAVDANGFPYARC